MIQLHVISDSIDKVIAIGERITVFGRSLRNADVALDWDRMVSSRHFQIELQDEGWLLTDLGSTNGTKVNSLETQRCRLVAGDEIQVGSTRLMVVEGTSSPQGGPLFDDESTVASAAAEPTVMGSDGVPESAREPVDAEQVVTAAPEVAGENPPIRQVCLRVASGAAAGRVFWIGTGNALVLGRSGRADCAFPDDYYMSSEHCRVACGANSCEVADLQSRGGTWLNGEAVTTATVYDGDELRVGRTVLLVELLAEGGGRIGPPENRVAQAMQVKDIAKGVKLAGPIPATQTELGGELVAVVGEFSEMLAPETLVSILSKLGNVYLIIDFTRIGQPLPTEFEIGGATLFPWLCDESAKSLPMVLGLDEWAQWPAGVLEAWGRDAVEIACSDLDKQELVDRLREMSRRAGPVDGIVGLCWPSVLRPLLATQGEPLVGRLFETVKLMACEGCEAQQWKIAGKPQVLEGLRGLGFDIHEQHTDNYLDATQ
jgi:pSer/pThr/pTyr-binding forkhead associated (FHA) protein